MNRLKYEKSPYLLQHKNNPVDWFPWGNEAFEMAKKQNKPIFLSIGYATCHWCHVMEHESFEDEEIAQLMNENFINIKVDREERPDIDSTYMTVCQMITGQGGWPLTIIMTPEKKPLFASTYIPKEARFQRLGLRQLIPGISGMWKNEPDKVDKAVQRIQEGFSRSLEFESGQFPGSEAVDFAAEQLMSRFDDKNGGFGSSPKFPSPHNLGFLLRQWYIKKEDRYEKAVTQTLKNMRLGGLWDHIGFGFHRYSTDSEWLLPHFEKMLYDQALLMIAYTEGWQISKDPFFEQTVKEIYEYINLKLSSAEGAFFSAEDADSEGEEGKFYVWTKKEIDELLSQENADFLKSNFQIKDEGNFEDESTGQLTGKNILHLKHTLNNDELLKFEDIRVQLYENREKRVPPLLDNKVLTDWNSLMIVALAKAGRVFDNSKLIDSSEKAFEFILSNMIIDEKLFHRYKDGEAEIDAFADDHAFLIWAALELYEATFKAKYLEKAVKLSETFIELFEDSDKGGFYFTQNNSEELLGRQKQIYDGAIPSSNSVAINCFLRLARFTGDTTFEEKADEIGKAFSADIIRSGSSITHALQGIQFIQNNPKEIVIVLGKDFEEESFDLQPILQNFHPFSVLLLLKDSEYPEIQKISPFVNQMKAINGVTTFYVCKNQHCEKPVTDLKSFETILNS